MTRLIMRRGPRPGKVYDLKTDIVTIGSGSKNDIVILDNDVSRDHCRLIRVMADYELHDLNSQRGTFVSGQRVNSGWLLKPGSFIELGENITLEYERSSALAELEQVQLQPPAPVASEGPDPAVPPFLVMTMGPKAGAVYPLKDQVIHIGRDLSNTIVIQDPEISRFHVILRWANGTFQIEDQGSTNGTLLNGARMQPSAIQPLKANDRVQLATVVEFRYTWQPDDVQIKTDVKPRGTLPVVTTRESPAADTEGSKVALLTARTTKRHTTRLGTGLQPGALVDHVFITYAREEWEAIVAPLTLLLQDASLNIWVDQYLVQGSDDWMLAVEQALSECWLLVVVVSPQSLEASHVRLAYRYFFNRDKPIIPLLYVATENLPPELKDQPSVRYDSHNRSHSFDALIQRIRQRQK